ILASADNAWYRVRKFIQRNKLPVSAATITVMASIGGLGMALWEAHVARDQAERATEISRFIASVFQQADPYENGFADIRAVDLLLRGRERVEQELRGRGSVQVELMCTIGASLYGLGANMQARSTFERARALARDPSRVPRQCSNDYADLLTVIGDYARADA